MILRIQFIITRKIPGIFLFLIIIFYGCQTQNNKTEILWDTYDVPHIYGRNAEEMYYAFGWAQMENHADLILRLYAQARGRASEFWGEQYLESDKKIWLFEIPEIAGKNYNLQDKITKSYLDSFVKGLNDYASAHPESIGEKVKQVLPVTGTDVMAHVLRVVCIEFIASEDLYNIKRLLENGSNAYAIAPFRSASGNAMLVTNPHLPWSDFFTWFEAHLVTGNFNAYGITLVGIPTLSMAFNNYLGWAFTVNSFDGSDRYKINLQNGGYILDGKQVEFEKKSRKIKILQTDGSLKELTFEFKYSKHGPVVGENNKNAFALKVVGLDNFKIFEQYHKMAGSSNINEFESALKMLQNPMFNILYADKSGNIMYLFNGNVPVRNEGDFAFWKGTIDGSDSKYIWKEIHAYDDLPKAINPPSGFLQNCNDPPWTCTYPPVLDPAKYPIYMAPRFMHLRAQRATNMILDNHSISFEQLKGYTLNTGLEAADRFLDDLLAAVDKYPDTTAIRAAQILKNWDRKTDSGSRGAVLFTQWFDMVNSNMFELAWDPEKPVTTPHGIKDQKLAVELLVKAAGNVQRKYGSIDIAWGDVHRFRMNGVDFPANGGPERFGIFRVIDFAETNDNKKYAVYGDTYIAITEFGEKVSAEVLLCYGNSTQPGNKHIGEQLKLSSEKKLRTALLKKNDILKNLERKESLNGYFIGGSIQ